MSDQARSGSTGARRQFLLGLLGASSLVVMVACAAPRPRSENPHAERIQDSRPERIAAQRAGAPGELELEQSDQRWGIDAARERRDAEKQKKNPAPPPPPTSTKSTVVPAP